MSWHYNLQKLLEIRYEPAVVHAAIPKAWYLNVCKVWNKAIGNVTVPKLTQPISDKVNRYVEEELCKYVKCSISNT